MQKWSNFSFSKKWGAMGKGPFFFFFYLFFYTKIFFWYTKKKRKDTV